VAAQHHVGGGRVHQQRDQHRRVGVHAQLLGSLDREAAAPRQRLDGLQAPERGAAQDTADPVVAQLGEQPVGLAPAGP
jgi:hypothetical protein